jgi:hypothetical protein
VLDKVWRLLTKWMMVALVWRVGVCIFARAGWRGIGREPPGTRFVVSSGLYQRLLRAIAIKHVVGVNAKAASLHQTCSCDWRRSGGVVLHSFCHCGLFLAPAAYRKLDGESSSSCGVRGRLDACMHPSMALFFYM